MMPSEWAVLAEQFSDPIWDGTSIVWCKTNSGDLSSFMLRSNLTPIGQQKLNSTLSRAGQLLAGKESARPHESWMRHVATEFEGAARITERIEGELEDGTHQRYVLYCLANAGQCFQQAATRLSNQFPETKPMPVPAKAPHQRVIGAQSVEAFSQSVLSFIGRLHDAVMGLNPASDLSVDTLNEAHSHFSDVESSYYDAWAWSQSECPAVAPALEDAFRWLRESNSQDPEVVDWGDLLPEATRRLKDIKEMAFRLAKPTAEIAPPHPKSSDPERPTANRRMEYLLAARPECHGWTARQFSDHLGVSTSTVHATQVWTDLRKTKEAAKLLLQESQNFKGLDGRKHRRL